jgi:hypothetical protein
VTSLARCLSVFGLALLLAGVVPAEDKPAKKEDKPVKKPAPISAIDQAFAFPKGVKLTEDQEKKIAELKKEYAAKVEEMQKKVNELQAARDALYKEINAKKMELLTDEQKEALKPKPKPKTDNPKDKPPVKDKAPIKDKAPEKKPEKDPKPTDK